MADDKPQPIVIKKVVKKDGHHGGSWKVAMADFMTAMMAFFLLMWLVGMTDAEQRGGISEYFQNPSRIEGQSDIPSNNPVQGPGGGSTSPIDLGGSPSERPEQIGREERAREQQRLERLLEDLQKKVETNANLQPYKDQLLLDLVDDGMRIQVVDKKARPMFALGSVRIKEYAARILREIAPLIGEVPNRLSITGHTDARGFNGVSSYTNWELSTERANAARRALVAGGLDPAKIARVVGLAARVPFRPEDPQAPINRRISIIVMTRESEQEIIDMRERMTTEMPNTESS
jgi:chemotaxis protein MotB